MPVSSNNIQTMLSVYAFKSIPAFAADLPPREIYTENFDEQIATVGQSVVTRVPTTSFSTLNDLGANGWESQAASSSNITATLSMLGHDHIFNVTEWDTIGEAQLLNTFGNILGKQVANGLAVQVFNQVTSSYFTNTVTVNSASNFYYTGSTGLQAIATKMDNLEIPQAERYGIITPNAYQSLVASNGIFEFLRVGGTEIIRENGYTSTRNSAYPGVRLGGFNLYKSPRLTGGGTPTLPYGGDKYTNSDKLLGFFGNKAGLVVAARSPNTINAPYVYSYVGTEPTSGFPFQFIAAFDTSKPAFRVGIYSLIGVAKANPYAIVPLLCTSGA